MQFDDAEKIKSLLESLLSEERIKKFWEEMPGKHELTGIYKLDIKIENVYMSRSGYYLKICLGGDTKKAILCPAGNNEFISRMLPNDLQIKLLNAKINREMGPDFAGAGHHFSLCEDMTLIYV